jgi:hypothetical protein
MCACDVEPCCGNPKCDGVSCKATKTERPPMTLDRGA